MPQINNRSRNKNRSLGFSSLSSSICTKLFLYDLIVVSVGIPYLYNMIKILCHVKVLTCFFPLVDSAMFSDIRFKSGNSVLDNPTNFDL